MRKLTRKNKLLWKARLVLKVGVDITISLLVPTLTSSHLQLISNNTRMFLTALNRAFQTTRNGRQSSTAVGRSVKHRLTERGSVVAQSFTKAYTNTAIFNNTASGGGPHDPLAVGRSVKHRLTERGSVAAQSFTKAYTNTTNLRSWRLALEGQGRLSP